MCVFACVGGGVTLLGDSWSTLKGPALEHPVQASLLAWPEDVVKRFV